MGHASLSSVLVLAAIAGLCAPTARAEQPQTPEIPPKTQIAADHVAKLRVPLRYSNVVLGHPTAMFGPNDHLVGFDGPEIMALLRPIIVSAALVQLEKSQTADGVLPPAGFAAAGVEIEFDPTELAARIIVPVPLRVHSAIRVAARMPPEQTGREMAPAQVSGYLNMRGAVDHVSGGSSGTVHGFLPGVVAFDGALNVLDTVLESTLTYQSGSSPSSWVRGDTRLVRDFPEDRNRLTIGDIDYGTTGFQTYEPGLGISFARNFDLQPYQPVTSTGERSFLLERPSTVEVFVNGQRVRAFDLQPGTYNIRDFPLTTGLNDVALQITDDTGRVETAAFPFVFDTSLLARGEQAFSYALGFPATYTAYGRRYDEAHPFVSAFHEIGVADNVTLGAAFQGDADVRNYGADVRWGSLYGIVRTDLAYSQARGGTADFAARLQYRYIVPESRETFGQTVLARITYRGPSFWQFGLPSAYNPVALDFGIVYGRRLYEGLYGDFSYDLEFGRSTYGNAHAVAASLNGRLNDEWTASVTARYDSQPGIRSGFGAMLTVSWLPFGSGHRISVEADSTTSSYGADWSYTPSSLTDNVQADATAYHAPDITALRGDASFRDYRFEADLQGTQSVDASGRSTFRTGLRAGTAVVYADGHFALSRPVTDSFAIVALDPSLRNHDVEIDPANGVPRAKADTLGPAVLPDLPPYFVHMLTLSAPNLPPGYDLGDQIYSLTPSYHSGTLIMAGTGATAMAEGTVVDSTGRPIELETGTIASLDAPEREPVAFFTDRWGRFRVDGLPPGRYRLRFDPRPGESLHFTLPRDAVGVHDFGTLVLKPDPGKGDAPCHCAARHHF
ncbi:MAG: fimbria/pilus outer membrane usher protein [Alphaproteobacteria bacterium]|nr:fimbria/pilus outer membrane usher protein [Alphaproteobacteria bacterium]